MINLIKFRRSGLWLLSFIAALLVLSPSAGAYYVRGWFPKTGDSSFANYWGDGQDMGTDNKYTFGTIENDEDIYFKLSTVNKGNEGTHYGFTKDNIFELQTNYGNPPTSNGSLDDVGQFKISAKKGKCYEISFNNNDLVLTVTDDNGGGGGETTTSNVKFKYVITEGTDNSVDMADESSQKDGTYYTCTITPDKTADDYWIAVNYNGTWVSGQNDNQTLSFNSNNQAGEDNCGSYADDLKRFKIHLDAGQPYKIEFLPNYDGKKRIHITKEVGLPVFPIGIYNRKQLETYNEPTYYLLGELLNYNRVTPEYQFTKVETDADAARLQKLVADGETAQIKKGQYILEFTARNTVGRWTKGANEWKNNCYMSVVGYETPKSAQKTLYEKKSWEELGWDSSDTHNVSGTNGDFLEGMAAIAVFDPTDNTANKLQIVKKKTGKLPFISLVGAEWKQNTVANDDKAYETPGGHSYPNNTDAGWQEAWIQYNDNNEIAKDLNGNVMYNTMWPPRNPIKFKTAFTLNGKEYDFTVSSDALVLNPVVDETTGDLIIQTGENWKNDDRFKDVQSGEVAKANLFTADGDLNKGAMTEEEDRKENEFFEKLALDNNTNYRLYKVENVWINGKFKFWTGWTGGVANNDGANWNNNANWGHYKQQPTKDDNNNPIPPQKISPKSTIPLGNVDGDMVFDEPTYFKTLYFFYDVNSGKETNHSVFFTEIAKGGAQIAALSRENYTYGMYCPALKDTEGIEKSTVKSVKITSYKYNDDDNKTPIKVVYDNSDCNTPVENWNQIFSQLKGETTTNQKTGKPEKWVYDSNKYENGHYKYVMEVVIDDEEPIVVESNPFTIFVGEAYATLKTYQLVKREIPTDDTSDKGLGETDYKYITYSTNPKDKTYFVNLKVENDSDTGLDIGQILNAEYDLPTEIVDVKEMTEAQLEKVDYSDGTRFRFSPKLLFVGTVTGKNVLDARFHDDDVAFTEIGKVKGATPFRLEDSTGDGKYDTFYGVGEPVFYQDLEGEKSSGFNYSYRWSSTFDYDFEDAYGDTQTKSGVTDEVVVDNYLVFPEPKLIIEESRIEMFYGDSPASDTDDMISNQFSINVADNMEGYESELSAVTLGDPTRNDDGARFQQIRTAIVVERPNITRRYIALAAKFIQEESKMNVSYNYNEADGSAPLMEALFDFFLGEDQVSMSNGMVYTDNGGNPEWFVYYTPTRKPSDIYYNVSTNDSIMGTNDWDLATNLGVVEGKFFKTKTMSHKLRKTFEKLHIYERWKDGDIAGIRIQQNPPENEFGLTKPASPTQSSPLRANSQNLDGTAIVYVDNEEWRDANIRVIGSGLAYNSNGDLIETVNVNIKFKSKTKNSLARVDKDGNPYDLNDDSYNGKDMHYDPDSNDDYFYVRVVNDKDEDLVEAKAISAKTLADGYTLKIEKNHGPWWDSEKGYDQLDFARDNSLIKTMTLKMSHLYPFIYGTQVNYITVGASVVTETTNAPARMMYKAGESDTEEYGENVSSFEKDITNHESSASADVIKSNPIEYTFMDGEVVTSVDELSIPAYGYVVSGVGYIEVHGEGAEIYGADGIKIATGEGRYEVGAGVYVVRLNGRVEKVIVR